MARYLGLVDPAAFVDRRNPEPRLYTPTPPGPVSIDVEDDLWSSDTSLPDFPSLPDYSLHNYDAQQRYHLEIWCEKSSQNDILIPLAQQYRINLVTGVGELSMTATLDAVRRFQAGGRPARILYVSDFDPAGLCMPVSVARKIEYFIRNESLDLDVRLFPVVLTAEQAQSYNLPRTPIKKGERRRDHFERRYGTGATELDALQSLYPDELRRILSGIIERYHDSGLRWRVQAAKDEVDEALDDIRQTILNRYRSDLDALEEEYGQLRQEFEDRMVGYGYHLALQVLHNSGTLNGHLIQ